MSTHTASAPSREQIETDLGESSLVTTHYSDGRLVGVVSDDTGHFAIASDGVSTVYEEHLNAAAAMRATTRLAREYVLRRGVIFASIEAGARRD